MDSELVVPSNGIGDETNEGNVFSIGYVPSRKLESIDPENFEALVKLFRPLAGGFFGKVIDEEWSNAGWYIQNVITFNNDRERDILHRHLAEHGRNFPRMLFGYSFETDHCHVIHSCAFSSSQCKCKWRRTLPVGHIKLGYRGRQLLGQWSRGDWLNGILYYFFKKGGIREAYLHGQSQGLQDSCRNIRWKEVEEETRRILEVSTQKNGFDICEREQDENNSGSIVSGRGSNNKGTKKNWSQTGPRRQTKWEIISERMEKLLEATAICPLESIKSEDVFLQDKMLTDPDNSTKVNKAIEIWSHKINNWSLRDFYNMYNGDGERNFIFSKSKDYFPNMDDSFKSLDDLLKYQFEDDESKISEFLQDLVNVVDKQPPGNPGINIKCNTFVVVSPPSAGKNFFFDTLFTLLLNFGQLGTANKHNNFAFQDAPNRRIILWNEPNYESSITDYLKTLFEGGDTKVRVKMMGDTHVKRTPIVVLTNNVVPFMVDSAFKSRIKVYRWQAAPFLKDLKFKPYPLVFFDLLLKYKIKF